MKCVKIKFIFYFADEAQWSVKKTKKQKKYKNKQTKTKTKTILNLPGNVKKERPHYLPLFCLCIQRKLNIYK